MAKKELLFDYSRFDKIRRDAGLTCYRVAMDSNVNPSTLSMWKIGAYEPRYETARRLADTLHVDVSEFFAREEKEDDIAQPV